MLGEYVEQDFETALHWILESCSLDYGVACYFAGTLVRDGVGVPSDLDATAPLMGRACGLGYRDGCTEIGCEPTGPGVEVALLPSDTDSELISLAGACDAGFFGACADLAEAWASGDGVPTDQVHADALLERSCDWALLRACRLLGRD